MFSVVEVFKGICLGCGKDKQLAAIETGRIIIHVCARCLDNASRLIAKKADKLKWNRSTMKWENLYQEDIKEFERLYPKVDVFHVLEKEIPEWINKQILSGKTVKSNWRSFILRWLANEQKKAIGL